MSGLKWITGWVRRRLKINEPAPEKTTHVASVGPLFVMGDSEEAVNEYARKAMAEHPEYSPPTLSAETDSDHGHAKLVEYFGQFLPAPNPAWTAKISDDHVETNGTGFWAVYQGEQLGGES